jgi:hypothetical protein
MKSIVAYLTEATLDQTKDVLKKAEWSREKTDALYPPNSKITQMTNFYSHERVGQRILSDGELRDGTKVYISPDGTIEER